MLYCKKCNVSIDGARLQCPLCQDILSGTPEQDGEIFPKLPTNREKYQFIMRTMIFASITIVVISVALNFLFPANGWWSVFVTAAIGCMWVSLSSAIRRRHNIPKNILWQVVILSALAVGWDIFTGWYGWSVDYAIPAVCVFAMVAVCGFAVFMKLRIEEFLIYLILDGLLGFVPLIFLLIGQLRVLYPSVICVAVSLISFAALCSFAWDELTSEVKKRLHL